MDKYNHKKIEAKWQKVWQLKKTFLAKDFTKKSKKYVLVEFPYPSGEGLHMGHLRPYVAGDVYSRFQRLKGNEVIFPIGWDAFGLPAENYAIKKGIHPSVTTKKNISNAKKQMQSWGLSFDWSREINTTDPNYYKWTQWLFLQFYKKGLAYEATGVINWCPKDKTGLANEEVIDGKCERCGTVVEKKELRQWYLKITAYAEKLLEGLKHLPEWPEPVKLQQENWIGKSVGAEIDFEIRQQATSNSDNKPNFIILHGWTGRADKIFLPWAKKQLENLGYYVQTPQMPNTDNPNEEEQVEFVIKNCKIDKNTVLVGHSLGAVVAMKSLLKLNQQVAGLILVDAAVDPGYSTARGEKPFWKTFSWDIDYTKLQKLAGVRGVISDITQGEPRVGYLKVLSQKLDAVLLTGAGKRTHFTGEIEPDVLKSILSVINFNVIASEAKQFNYLILHGRNGSPSSHTFPWLKSRLESNGCKVQAPLLPNTEEPDDNEQADFVIKNCKIDENTVIVGHSFGGVVALRLLERGIKVKKVVLLCTPYSGKFLDNKPRPSVTRACKQGFNFEKILPGAESFSLLYDTTDYVVPMSDGETFAKKLNTPLVKIAGKEPHLSGAQEPEVLENLISFRRHSEGVQLTEESKTGRKGILHPSDALGVQDDARNIKVFTTRPDTIFGATYMVVAPEHPLVKNYELQITNYAEVREYIERAKKKSEMDRTSEGKEKTGVELKGIKAINPATKEEISVWVADYVLWGYGTGAIMAVPAHDERDFEFAKKFHLPIKQVIVPTLMAKEGHLAFHHKEPFMEREVVRAIVKHWEKDEYAVMFWKNSRTYAFISGGVEKGETKEQAIAREIKEESGYLDIKVVKSLGTIGAKFFAPEKKQNRFDTQTCFYVELKSPNRVDVAKDEEQRHVVEWLPKEKIANAVAWGLVDPIFWARLQGKETASADYGVLINSDKFNGLSSQEAILKIAEEFGKAKTQYKLRDWVFSRQRYWGEPIPIIHCPKCGIVPVPEKDLPVKLPSVKNYQPTGTGESPLAAINKWVNVKCPVCKSSAKRETNTMPQWAGSSWYWLRYTDPKNKKSFADLKKQKYWTPVDVYFGGMEHTTLHLLYSRFWNLFLYDQGLVTSREPYAKRKPHGIILGPDGEKMSKSRGNVVNPQDIVASHGADTLRMFELFLGPHEDTIAWNSNSVVGVKRFLDRVWVWTNQVTSDKLQVTSNSDKAERALHKLIKKITEDIENFSFNTSISAFMEFHNEVKDEQVTTDFIKTFLKLLSPFAPHIAEELNFVMGSKKTLQQQEWPKFDPTKIVDATVEIVVQVNGKVKGKVIAASGSDENTVKALGTNLTAVKILLEGKQIKRVIFVPNRLVNLVI